MKHFSGVVPSPIVIEVGHVDRVGSKESLSACTLRNPNLTLEVAVKQERLKKICSVSLVAFSLVNNPSFAKGYDFCVVRLANGADTRGSEERFHARFKYGEIDPGREAARVLTLQQFKKSSTNSIKVTNYVKSDCPGPEVQEFTVSASLEQVSKLASEIGKGDVAGAAVTTVNIVAGGAKSLVKGAGKVLKKVF